jgi:hypothetical protein
VVKGTVVTGNNNGAMTAAKMAATPQTHTPMDQSERDFMESRAVGKTLSTVT